MVFPLAACRMSPGCRLPTLPLIMFSHAALMMWTCMGRGHSGSKEMCMYRNLSMHQTAQVTTALLSHLC